LGFSKVFFFPIAVAFVLAGTARPSSADRFVSVDLGYFNTTSSRYQSGFTYGIGLTEGKGKIGFGITALRFGNTYYGEVTTSFGGEPDTAEFAEDVVDFVLTIMGIYRLNNVAEKNHVMIGAGPQVHFINSRRSFSTFSESARDFRLGAGAFARYQRRLEMFGSLGFVLSASYCHMQSVSPRTDLYDVPTSSMNITMITAGFAFPF
jgi:hypothetical protein